MWEDGGRDPASYPMLRAKCLCSAPRAATGLALKLQPSAAERRLRGRPPERTYQGRTAASIRITKG